ncbi:MAG TPA: HypC/HybG/HupF family hydrogenase formation chaperone [Bacteroidales bacterium]|nr:HypC/HybG/HupF family hydrogenase formation chaperone [Bacteroidales bacterium]HPJ58301.1 HypC/HybG/HupF family hydrogenase formation chaperone [Bacteroidales bacterium]HPR10893.1 HypC/HybG/HupF family hydrogenase formation chaperone [Bacteroidales bacterium]HRW84147.1 HypC/HybG/HupF family hydrogenase formation chaperone [Bacteroidales bacterium]
MCLSIPVQILSIEGDMAEVSAGGTIFRAGLQMIGNVSPGDYVLLHAGFAIQKISEEEAEETLRILREIGESS